MCKINLFYRFQEEIIMSLKAQKSKKLKEMELQKISFMVDCLKEKVKNEEAVTPEDKQEFLDDVGASIDTLISFNDEIKGPQSLV